MIKDDLLSVGVLLESSKIVKEDHLEGSRFTNAGYEWKVLGQKGEYTLVHAPLKRFQPYVVAWNLSDDGSWGQGHYFNDERAAKSYFKKVTKDLEEDTVRKSNGKWTNRGDDGTEHGEFGTKAEADAQRKAMFAQGYKGESLDEAQNPVVTKVIGGDDWVFDGEVYDSVSEDPIAVYDNYVIEGATSLESAKKLFRKKLRSIVGNGIEIRLVGRFHREEFVVDERQTCPKCKAPLNDDGGCSDCDNGPLL